MTALVSREHLLDFISSLGISREPFADADRNELLGFVMTLMESEAMGAFDPSQFHTAVYKGFGKGVTTIADTTPNISARTFSLMLAQHTIVRLIEQVDVLTGLTDGEPPYIPPILHNLFAAGGLVELMSRPTTPATTRETVRSVQQHFTEGRRALDDVKKALRAAQVAV